MSDLYRAARRGAAALAVTLAGTQTAAAQEPPPSADTARLTPPVLVSRAEATYPPEALSRGIEATVGLEVVVDEHGTVVDARVTAPAGSGFDEAALEAVRRFVFEPARSAGLPIRSSVQLAYVFRLPPPAPAARPTMTPAPVDVVPPAPAAPPPQLQQGANQSTLVVAPKALPASIQEPESTSASDSSTGQEQLSLRPRFRAENVLEVVPGLFSVQHAGGGKAQQYFMRGFDLDHGTDLAFFVDGLPINAVSHAHGQGFSDLHFLIPETIDTVESTKGPYSARVGDFATAGSTTFHMADHVPESQARLELGPDNHQRAVVVESPDLGESWRAVVAAEAFTENGPFIHPEDYDRLNGYLKATRVIDSKSEVSTTLMVYGGTWNMSGVLPARAVCGEGDGTPTPTAYAGSHCISRWDSIDPSQGGESQRMMALASYRRQLRHGGDLEATAYALRSSLELFPNDGIAASFQPAGIQYGSQVEQDDQRTETGVNTRYSQNFDVAATRIRTTFGLQFRNDAIDSELHRTEQRQRLDGMPGIPGPITDSAINETETGAYAEADWHLTPWLRFVVGGREDRIDVGVTNQSDVAVDQVSGYRGQAQFSPKATAVVSPIERWDLFANYGTGFHSNDARTLIEGNATTLMATATGYEVGTAVRPVEGMSITAVAFLLDLTSEQTIDGDTASTSPSGPTRRYGGEFTGRYQFKNNVFIDAAFTVAHSRYTDSADIDAGQSYVTLAPVRTLSAGAGVREPIGPYTVMGGLFVRSMSDRAATQDDTLIATGFTLFNAEAGLRWKNLEAGADLLNIGDVAWREGQFAVNSRLPGEGPNPPVGVSFTPGLPRTLLVHGALYW